MNWIGGNLSRALLALILSFALWTFVSFSQNPEETVRFDDVALQIVGRDDTLVIVDSTGLPTSSLPTVDITLVTDQRQRSELRAVDLRAVVDLSGLTAGEHQVPVNVQPTRSNLSFSVAPDGVAPSSITVRLEPLITVTLPIDLEILGSPPFSFERGQPEIRAGGTLTDRAAVSGPQSAVERVTALRASANISQLRATYVAPLTLQPVDEGGQPVEGVRVTPTSATVLIPINPVVGLRIVPIEPVIVGAPAAGYSVRAVVVEPPLVSLTGSSGALDAVTALKTEPIDISAADGVVTRLVALQLPEGTSFGAGESSAARVTVRIEPIELPFQARLPVSIQLSGLADGLTASFSPQSAAVNVSGSSGQLGSLAGTALLAVIDLNGLPPGEYPRVVTPRLPAGITVVGDPPVVTVVIADLPTPTAEPTETQEPEPTEQPPPTATRTPPTATGVPITPTAAAPTPTPTPTLTAAPPTATAAPEPEPTPADPAPTSVGSDD
jgi:YbbR domain-containing protein